MYCFTHRLLSSVLTIFQTKICRYGTICNCSKWIRTETVRIEVGYETVVQGGRIKTMFHNMIYLC